MRRMVERGISRAGVIAVLSHGDTVEWYPDDDPYPSRLLTGTVGGRVLHVVVADDPASQSSVIITAYEPDAKIWEMDKRTRRQR